MKIVMLSVYDDGKKPALNPGDIVDTDGKSAPFDADEAERIVSVGGARMPTADDLKLRDDGPTVALWVERGYKASAYPPSGYASKSTPEEIAAAIEAEAKAPKK